MKLCVYCGKKLKPPKRKYCGKQCSRRFLREGPARERFVYKEAFGKSKEEIDELTSKGSWFLFPASMDNEQCIGEFIRKFKRPPEHCLWSPTTPIWKFLGPVQTEEELAHRWRGQ